MEGVNVSTRGLFVDRVHRSFGKLVANCGVSLNASPGEVVVLLGHNGAGKTTLISQISGLLKPDSGTIRVDGIDVVKQPKQARSMVSVQPQSQAPVEGLTPRAAIEISAQLRGATRFCAGEIAESLAEELEIVPWIDQRALPEGGGLSGGIRRLTSFAMAVAQPTKVLVLDEPTNDVDAHRRRLLWSAVRSRADQGTAVLVVTHSVAEVEPIADRVVMMQQGSVIANGTIEELRGGGDMARLTLTGGFAGRRVRNIHADEMAAATAWAMRERAAGRIDSFAVSPMTLEDIYLDITESCNAEQESKSA